MSLDKIKRYIRLMRSSSPETDLVINLAQYGADVIRNKYMPTPRNDAERPGQRVLIDARPLPMYIKHNGIVCTVAILLMIDDFSRFPIRARLVPRKIVDWNNLPKRADITADDVAVLIASAIWFDDFCFEELYTDNASSNKAVGKLLAEITADELIADITGGGDTFIHFVKSIPGRPRACGKVEKALGLLNEAIDGHPGFVADEGDWKCLHDAQNHPELYPLEKVEKLLNDHLEHLRDRSFGNRKQTRRELWTSKGKRPALPIRKLVHSCRNSARQRNP
ncbi:MAG: transposase family protein [Chloroflexaceae bacterium]|nr:transposase family protein [Chloroflexaceae bacterium]